MRTNVRRDMRTRKMAAGRQAYLLSVLIVLLGATLARPAAAQDFNPGQMYFEMGMSNLRNEVLFSPLYVGAKRGSAPSPTRPPASKFDSRYRADPAVTRRIINEYLSFVRSVTNEQTMRKMQEDLGRFNFVTVWRNIVRSAGLEVGEVADAMTSYLMLNWEMANDQVRKDNTAFFPAVREQIRGGLATSPAFAKLSDADKQGFAETMMINFVVQQSVITHAVQSNDKDLERRLGDAAQQRFQKEFDMNLRNLDLTRNGLVARQ